MGWRRCGRRCTGEAVALQDRESAKLALLAAALTDALRSGDVAETTAPLAAETGVAVFWIAFERWFAGGDQRDPAHHIRELLDELATFNRDNDDQPRQRRLRVLGPSRAQIAVLSASALSVRSHGRSMSVRPKWPYAAVGA